MKNKSGAITGYLATFSEGSNPSFRAKTRNRAATKVARFFLYLCGFAGNYKTANFTVYNVVCVQFWIKITHEITHEIYRIFRMTLLYTRSLTTFKLSMSSSMTAHAFPGSTDDTACKNSLSP